MSVKPERVYAALLRLYPRSFREAYGAAMLETFREVYRRDGGCPWRFWASMLADVARSAGREWIDTRSPFTLHWTIACAGGAVATGALGSAMSGAFGYFYHPYLEGMTVPVWAYGALLGLGLAVTQSIALRNRTRLGTTWVVVTTGSAALGLEMAVLVARVAGPVAYGVVLGSCVAGGQWIVLRTQVRRVGWRVMSSAVAFSAGVLSCGVTLTSALQGVNALTRDALAMHAADAPLPGIQVLLRGLYAPSGWAELAVELGTLATAGVIVGALTARPLSLIVSRAK